MVPYSFFMRTEAERKCAERIRRKTLSYSINY